MSTSCLHPCPALGGSRGVVYSQREEDCLHLGKPLTLWQVDDGVYGLVARCGPHQEATLSAIDEGNSSPA